MGKVKKLSLFIFVLFVLANNKVLADKLPLVKRLEGKNRIETSIEISKDAFESSKTVIIVGYNGEVDALTGTILAERKDAPILMSNSKKLDKSLEVELKRLGCKEVFILGGSSAVEEQVEESIKALGLKVKRIKGNSREETAINIAQESIVGQAEKAFLSLGYGTYADALAIGPIAASKNVPLLLTATEKMGQATIDYIDGSGIKEITIVGGNSAVGVKVENTLKEMGIKVSRIKGNSREETAINIAKNFIDDPKKIFLANGYKYADAVVGGYLAAKENSPILLNNNWELKDINKSYIEDKQKDITVIGGNSSIDELIFNDLQAGLGIISDISIPSKPITPNTPNNPSNFDELKKVMRKELEALKSEIIIKYEGNITSEKVREAIQDIYNDGSYIGGTISSITPRVRSVENGTEISFSAKYYNTLEEEKFIDSEVSRILKTIIRPNMSEFEKVRSIHDYIINNTNYTTNTKKTPHSAYAVFKEKKGVCQGYTLAAYRLLDKLGIENYYLVGKSMGTKDWESHSWNLVKIDGKYYNMDITKNDPPVSDGNDILSYKYFLVSDKKFSQTHKANRNVFPKAVDSKYEVLNGARDPFEYNGNLYFGNKDDDSKLYSLSLKDLKLKRISDEKAPFLVVNNNTIYFSNYSQGGYIYKSDLNGKNLARLNKVHSINLKLENTKITFLNKVTNKLSSISII